MTITTDSKPEPKISATNTKASSPPDAHQVAARLGKRERLLVRQLIAEVRIAAKAIEIELDPSELAKGLGLSVEMRGSQPLALFLPITLTRCGRAVRLIQQDGRPAGPAEPREHD